MLTLFFRSAFEILTHTGAGYLDSLSGLVFFLLIGKWFQQRTYHNISFDRDYRSYFPIAAWRKTERGEDSVTLDKLEAGDHIIVRNQELIPADGVLISEEAKIDYSFVTGEARPVTITSGEKVFAGGRQMGGNIEVALTRRVSQSYLTQLWNEEAFAKSNTTEASALADTVGKYFTAVILLIAFSTLAYWLAYDPSIAFQAFTAVLIIACPCAVALSIPFTFGNVLRVLGKNQFYLKNTQVIEALQKINAIVFDKTGTLTSQQQQTLEYEGEALSEEEKQALLALSLQSSHPISRQLAGWLKQATGTEALPTTSQVADFKEYIGKGIEGLIHQKHYRIGSAAFIGKSPAAGRPNESKENHSVYIQAQGKIKGGFHIHPAYRKGLPEVMQFFRSLGRTFLLSGDNKQEKKRLTPFFTHPEDLRFEQSPKDKLHFIEELQSEGKQVLTMGDGLNDAGALKQSHVGVVITENTNNFTPACDAILHASRFERLPDMIDYARKSIKLVYMAYGLAFIYNVIGLSFAVQGLLSPVIAAILMPASSITIVLFGMGSSNLLARMKGLTGR
jgi:Cu+-exporting ATPase